MLHHILLFLKKYLYIMHLRDGVEIIIFASCLYLIQRWLAQDNQKNMLGYLYGYAGMHIFAYHLQLHTVSTLLLISAPIVGILFILFHQQTLQKNFILLQRLQTPQATHDWFVEFTKSMLTSMNTGKEIIYVIERNDALSDTVFAGCAYYADIQRDSMNLFLEKHVGGATAFIWINQDGKLIAINATWRQTDNALWTSPEAKILHKWKQDALYITQQSDAIICKVDPVTRACDVVVEGKLIENMIPEATIRLLQRYLLDKKKTDAHSKIMSQKQTELSI